MMSDITDGAAPRMGAARAIGRRAFGRGALALPALLAARGARAEAAALNIGYQKNGALLILKQHGTLEQVLGPRGITVTWHEFPSGPPLLEALGGGSIDFGATGDTPPLYAQAAGTDLVYVGYIPQRGKSSAILVAKDGPIHTLADLRGRRVGFTRGSSAHNVVVQALKRAGLTYGDITPVYLQPPDAMAAFQQGAIDAWSIWDPFYAIAERDPATRVLTTAEGLAPTNSFFLARRGLVHDRPDVVRDTVGEIRKVVSWIATHQDALAAVLSQATGVPQDIWRFAAARGDYDAGFMTDAVVAQQQAIADTFAGLGLLPQPVHVRDAVWSPSA